ncbi:hypothetical protein ACFE04_031393 [Oxalis oulophora]
MAKRPCPSSDFPINAVTVTSTTTTTTPLSQMDQLLDTFLSLTDSSPSLSLDLSFERLIDSSPSDSHQSILIDRARKLGSLLLEAGNRSARKRASIHNSYAWALPSDLTIKVFSMLDTQSLCYATATCSMFHKCALDPSCYENVDLTTDVPKINNTVVYTMIKRAGKALRSLKLGIVPGPITSNGSSEALVYTISGDATSFSWYGKKTRQGKESSILTRSCLSSLSGDSGAAGSSLTRLHLYNVERIDNVSLHAALKACPSLLDLEIVGLHVELRHTLASVSANCHSVERLFFESSKTGRDDSLKSPTCVDFVNNCPNLSSLALRGFKLHDNKVRILVKGFRQLRHADFSTSYSITGTFLRNLGNCAAGDLLEVLNLRDCMHLKEGEVARFLTSVIAGDFKYLRHIDMSNREGLASEGDWYERCYSSSIIPWKKVTEERPNICLLAEFPSEASFINVEEMIDSDLEFSISSQLSSDPSDGPFLLYSSESSYNSDHGSGNEGEDSGI